MASLPQESRGLLAADVETLEDESLLLPRPAPRNVWCPGHRIRRLGIVVLGLMVIAGLGGTAHRPLTTAAPRAITSEWEKKGPLHAIHGPLMAGAAGNHGGADKGVQKMVDGLKARVPSLLKLQGWSISLGSFKALASCRQGVGGHTYVVKVQIADDKVSKVARAGEVLQMIIYRPSDKTPPMLTSVQIVARDDKRCFALPLTPPPALPHVVLDATPNVQALCDAVKDEAAKRLKNSGWHLSLVPYKALSYCSDGLSYIVKVEVANSKALHSQYPDGIFLQLLLSVAQGKGADTAILTDALMVKPVAETCASLPVLPPLDHPEAQASKGRVDAIAQAPKSLKSPAHALAEMLKMHKTAKASKPALGAAPAEPDEKEQDGEAEASEPHEISTPELKPNQKDTSDTKLHESTTAGPKPQGIKIPGSQPRKTDIAKPEIHKKLAAGQEPTLQKKDVSESKPQEKKIPEPEPHEKAVAAKEPQDVQALQPKPQKKDIADSKPQEKKLPKPELHEKAPAVKEPQDGQAVQPKPQKKDVSDSKPQEEKTPRPELHEKVAAEKEQQEGKAAKPKSQTKSVSGSKPQTKIPEQEVQEKAAPEKEQQDKTAAKPKPQTMSVSGSKPQTKIPEQGVQEKAAPEKEQQDKTAAKPKPQTMSVSGSKPQTRKIPEPKVQEKAAAEKQQDEEVVKPKPQEKHITKPRAEEAHAKDNEASAEPAESVSDAFEQATKAATNVSESATSSLAPAATPNKSGH